MASPLTRCYSATPPGLLVQNCDLKRYKRCYICKKLRIPEEIWIVEAALVVFEVPIFRILESRGTAIEKANIRAAIVKIGVDVVLLGYAGLLAVIE